MHDFVLKEIKTNSIGQEIEDVGFDKTYIAKACQKFQYKNIKIYSLSVPQVNILKQTALSVGADCATHREAITAKVDKSDCILGGSISQLRKIAEKLKFQPFGLKELAITVEAFLEEKPRNKTKIMGILNLSENSFSDGGIYSDTQTACNHLVEMIKDGADIIDIGAESTKPGAKEVSAEDQLKLILPVLDFVNSNNIKTPISIDTRNAEVAKECIERGATIINDVSGLEYNIEMVNVIANSDARIIIQHSKGTPDIMQDNPVYENLMDEIYLYLREKVELAVSKGISKDRIIVDAGIGFGKTKSHNFDIINRSDELKGLGCEVMLGVSRKSLLGMPDSDNLTKDILTTALNMIAIEHNIDILRVHNVKFHSQLMQVLGELY